MLAGWRRRKFVTWARDRAIALQDADPARCARRLEPLAALLRGRRLAFLGETNHQVHEKYAYRERFLRWLRGHGFSLVGEELSASDGARIARFIETGDRTALRDVTTFGYTGCRRADRDDSPRGVLAERLRRHPGGAFRAEQTRQSEQLRALGGIRYFGFDVDYEPGIGYERLAEEFPDALRGSLARVPGETLEDEVRRLERACAGLDASDAPPALRALARTCWQSHAYLSQIYAARDYEALRPAMSLREERMVEHVRAARDASPERACVLMSHAFHLARAEASVRLPRGAIGPGGGQRPALGVRLAADAPGGIFTVWMCEGSGADSDGPLAAPRGSLNALLGQVGDSFALPVRGAPLLERPVPLAIQAGMLARVDIAQNVDVLVFERQVSPLRA